MLLDEETVYAIRKKKEIGKRHNINCCAQNVTNRQNLILFSSPFCYCVVFFYDQTIKATHAACTSDRLPTVRWMRWKTMVPSYLKAATLDNDDDVWSIGCWESEIGDRRSGIGNRGQRVGSSALSYETLSRRKNWDEHNTTHTEKKEKVVQ